MAWLWASKLYHIPHKCQMEVLTENLEPWDLRRVWLFRIVKLMKKQFFCPFPHVATGSCCLFCHFYQHHPCGDFNPVQWLASGWLRCHQHKVTFCWWIIKMCQHVYIRLVHPNHYWHVTTCRDPNVTFSIFSVLIVKLPGILIWFGITVPQKFILFFVRLLIYVRRRNGTVHI